MITEINDLGAGELLPYTDTSELALRNEQGLFVAESPKVIRTALDAGFTPVSFLAEKKYISGQASDIIARFPGITVYTAASELLTQLTGFRLTQGIMCAMKRKPLPEPAAVLAGARRIAVLESMMNQTNVGAVFRSAAALGMDAVILTRSCSDPLFRRSVRVSMGTVFQLPWTYTDDDGYIDRLRGAGFAAAAMALHGDSVSIDDPRLAGEDKLAVILGTEGSGLREETIRSCDYTVTIPMCRGVDSLNAAAAGAIAFYVLSRNENLHRNREDKA